MEGPELCSPLELQMSLSCVFSSREVQTFGHSDASYTSLWQDCLRAEPGKRPCPALAAPLRSLMNGRGWSWGRGGALLPPLE